ncbi:hypothetical protein ABT352_36230 [Streptosporangium sp. NPDC000563]|uniref:hypothetical protein n=1 Tax=Streptosporangium sp. NPDC000563 TaxID=3154366 RepID=UPI00331B6406
MSAEAWHRLQPQLMLGQRLQGTVLPAPWPAGVTGIFVDLRLPVVGFVDVLLLPHDAERWPAPETVTQFEIWWMDDRPQIRLKPVDPAYLRDDFEEWVMRLPGSK